jgi:Terminase RNaseH-like domain
MDEFGELQANSLWEFGRNERKKNDRDRLIWMGDRLDFQCADLGGETLGVWLARTLLRVRNRTGATVALEANRAQREYDKCRGQRNIVLKARQMGMSTWLAARFFLKTITRPGTLSVQVAHTQEAAEQIFRIVHRFYENLPEALREGALRASRANSGQIVFGALDSEYRVESAADLNAGRGMTIQNLHCSEVARWRGDAYDTLASLRAALVPNGELVLESTPNGANGCFYEEWRSADETGTVRHFFPWWMEPTYAGFAVPEEEWNEEETDLAKEHGLAQEQIGFRRHLRASFRGMAAQEYAENAEACFLASGSCVFDLECIEKREREIHEPIERRLNGNLWIWYPPQMGRKYVIGVDPAGGGSDGDFAALQVIELQSGLQCAELQGHLNPREMARVSAAAARQYNGALLAIERNNHGLAVLAYLSTVERYSSIYEQRGMPGWLTTAVTRPEMIETMGAMLIEKPQIISSARLLAECRTFVRRGDGRTEASAGSHDDCVMAMALALRVRAEVLGDR